MARKKLLFSPLAPQSSLTKRLQQGSQVLPALNLGLRAGKHDTRPLAARHVVDLAESISVLGLLEPIVVDTDGHLLAGAHRRAAVQLLAIADPAKRQAAFVAQVFRSDETRSANADPPEGQPAHVAAGEIADLAQRIQNLSSEAFVGQYGSPPAIPVQVIALPVADRDARSLAIETAENNVRRQYTHDEIIGLAERFRKAGYRCRPGKPKRGERTMLSALEAAVGRSKRQIQNILTEGDKATVPEWNKAMAALRRAAQRIISAGQRRTSQESQAIIAASQGVLTALGTRG